MQAQYLNFLATFRDAESPDEDYNMFSKIIRRATQEALSGNFKTVYKPDKPLKPAVISLLRVYGFTVTENNYTYLVSWESEDGQK